MHAMTWSLTCAPTASPGYCVRVDGLAGGVATRTDRHAVEQHMAVIARREHIAGIPTACIWLSNAEQRFAQQALSALPGSRWLALAPGARWEPKRWPVRHFITLANRLQPEFDAVLLLGSTADTACCRELAAALSLPCLDLAGKTTLLQAGALLQQASLFVGNDSGPGHLAAAAGIPSLTLFGPGDPPRYRPWNPQGHWLQSPERLGWRTLSPDDSRPAVFVNCWPESKPDSLYRSKIRQ